MYKLLLTIPLLLSYCCLLSQNIVISGTVFNAKSKKTVAYANIGIQGETIGTVSNEKGEFEFHFPLYYRTDSLMVSCIGYYTYTIAISDISNLKQFKIILKPRSYLLDEVTVKPAELSPQEIIDIAMRRVPINYFTKPYMMDGFYREYFKENGKFSAFAEASVSIYDDIAYKPIDEKHKELIRVNQLRVSDIYNDGDYVLYIDLNYALRGNVIRNMGYWKWYARKARYRLESLNMDSISYFDGDPVYCISYNFESNRRGNYSGSMFIRTLDFAVLKVEIHAFNKLKGRNINGAPKKSHAVMTFKEQRGKLYLNYINASHEVVYQTKEERYRLDFFSELLINDIEPDDVAPIPENERMTDASIFYQPRYRTYDPEFWEDYNLFTESAANDTIISDLEKTRELEVQYKANGKMKVKPRQPASLQFHK